LKTFADRELLSGYLQEAVWFWFDASTREKSLEAGFHRLAARCILEEIRRRGLEEPAAELIYRQARKCIPLDDLRRPEPAGGFA
jgi:hypothetical protein